MKVAITGATGFVGQRLARRFDTRGVDYIVISRSPARARQALPGASDVIGWNPPEAHPSPDALSGLDGVVHLAGATVARRWTTQSKNDIRASRVLSTRSLVEALSLAKSPPAVLVSTSAIGYYGPCDDTKLDEDAAPGSDFLSTVCQEWEAEALKARQSGVRVVTARLGVVLGHGGGALLNMLTPFKMGVGGPIGSGTQWMSWIHIDDVVGLIGEALSNPDFSGPVNLTAPEPVTNREFSRILGCVLHRPAILPTPVFALKLAFGEFADILATGQRVIPEKALRSGYGFRFPKLGEALGDVLGKR